MSEVMLKKIDELEKRNEKALAGGGPQKLAKHKQAEGFRHVNALKFC